MFIQFASELQDQVIEAVSYCRAFREDGGAAGHAQKTAFNGR
jgi:hypothetical protein